MAFGSFWFRVPETFPSPFDLEEIFFAEAFLAAVFLGASFRGPFLSIFEVFARAFIAFGVALFFTAAFDLVDFFAALFLAELAIISVLPLGRRARAEA